MTQELIKEMAARGIMGSVCAYNVPIVNAFCLQDDVLAAMLALDPRRNFVACYTDLIDGRRWQLLSDGRVNVGILARSIGGDGTRTKAWFVQKLGWGHLIVEGPPLLRCVVEDDS